MNTTEATTASTSIAPPGRAVTRAILWGGVAVGALDALDGVAFYRLAAGLGPIQVLQYIASGLLGSAAFDGGLPAAALGALIHFTLAYGFTAALVLAFAVVPRIREFWVLIGLGWGVAVWAVMNLVVLPHASRVAPSPLTAAAVVNGVVGHALTVGLVPAWVTRRLGAWGP